MLLLSRREDFLAAGPMRFDPKPMRLVADPHEKEQLLRSPRELQGIFSARKINVIGRAPFGFALCYRRKRDILEIPTDASPWRFSSGVRKRRSITSRIMP